MDIIIAFLSGGVGVAIVNAISNFFSNKRMNQEKEIKDIKNDTALLKMANQSLLRISLRAKWNECKAQGFITMDDLADWDAMYSCYHSLGRNGVLDTINQKIRELEVKEDL